MRVAITDIAVDFDDTCVVTFDRFRMWHNKAYGHNHTVKDYVDVGPHYGKLWNTERAETLRRCTEFHLEHEGSVREMPNCLEVLTRLKERYRFHMLTFRNQELDKATRRTEARLFPGVFHRTDVCGWGGADASVPPTSKAKICQERGIPLIIEDALDTALECAAAGIDVFLMDAEWNRTESPLPANVIRVSGWLHIERLLNWHETHRNFEAAIERSTGMTVEHIRQTPLCELRSEVEARHGRIMSTDPPGLSRSSINAMVDEAIA